MKYLLMNVTENLFDLYIKKLQDVSKRNYKKSKQKVELFSWIRRSNIEMSVLPKLTYLFGQIPKFLNLDLPPLEGRQSHVKFP